jgi:hypothetical protein
MRSFVLALIAMLPLTACAVSSSTAPTNEDLAATSEDELSATRPIPYVMQYAGQYNGDGKGSFDWLVMRRTGTFVAGVDGMVKHGRYYGPRKPTDPLRIVFVTSGEHPWTGVITGWQANPRMTMTRNGVTEPVVATFMNTNEDMCTESGGEWTDDDADPVTGLFCICKAPTPDWIPSLGGCVK